MSTPPSLPSIIRFGFLRIDPDVVMVAVVHALDDWMVLPPSMLRSIGTCGNHTSSGFVRVDGERRVVPGPLAERARRVDQLPVLAAVVRSEQAAFLGFDQGIDAAAVRRCDRDADLAPDALRAARCR